MLESLFAPRGVAVIGATRDESKLGFGVAHNLATSGYEGAIHFVNPTCDQILGHPCYPSIRLVPDPVDLAVVIVPAGAVPQALEDCGQRGVRAAIVISGGFGETGERGKRLEGQLVEIARRWGMRLVGPNCVGIIDTHLPLNTTFVRSVPKPGEMAFISQSGAICQALIDWGTGMGVGFSRIASLGNQADVSEAEVIAALADDDHTRVVTMYLEGVHDGRQFLQVVGQTTRRKAVVALKVGRTPAGRRAVPLHTGALAGQEAAYTAAFARCGVLRADTTEELLDWSRALAWCPPMRGENVAVLTTAGGPGILAADALEASGLHLAALSGHTRAALKQFAHPLASLENPVDLLASGGPRDYAAALRALLADAAVDAVLVVCVPPPLGDPAPVAEAIVDAAQGASKPVVVAVMGEATTSAALQVLRAARIPDFRFPEGAASALSALRRQACWQSRPSFSPTIFADVAPDSAAQLLSLYQSRSRASLTQERQGGNGGAQAQLPGSAEGPLVSGPAATAILAEYGIKGPREVLASSEGDAVTWAERLGFPLALKVDSPDIVHKSDVGGVALSLIDVDSVRRAFQQIVATVHHSCPEATIRGVTVQQMVPEGQEVIIGAVRDEQFGPLVIFGAGGVEVEGVRDVAFGLAPLSRAEAESMVDSTCAGRRLRGYRSIRPADRAAAVEALLRLAQFAADFSQVAEVEINPLKVLREGCGAIAVDARLRLKRFA